MLLLPPLNVPGVLLFDRVYDATHRLSIAQQDWIGGGNVIIKISNDGGLTWTQIADFVPLNGNEYILPSWDGADTYIILCDELAGADGQFRSTDGGDSWARTTSIAGDSGFDPTKTVDHFAYGLNAWWHMRADTGAQNELWKSTDNGDNWVSFQDFAGVEFDFLIHPVYGIIAWDVDTTSGGIAVSVDGVVAMGVVLSHAAAPWLRMDDRDAMFVDGNGNLFGLFQNTGNFLYFNDDLADLSSWKEAAIIRPGGQTAAAIAFSVSGPGKWLWDGSRTHRRGFNSAFTVDTIDPRFVCWHTVDGSAWYGSPLNYQADLSDNGKYGSLLLNNQGASA